ncbi:hypothetical protein COLO4_25282 [Corchorus olitorius]|uniref:Uncharacterized protein n=1 Tax=Corchorus olitorius TaxID=93759 RepID=A0A1R3I3Q8_9ROSI|nr:hypothetical protein COLO4_25282 [Corchorus olitorius]
MGLVCCLRCVVKSLFLSLDFLLNPTDRLTSIQWFASFDYIAHTVL